VPESERQPRKSTLRRRATVLEAALRCFTRQGLAATTIADVRRASRTSIGSIYHHFRSKEELASALYLQSLELYQEGLMAKLEHTRKAERGVRTLVEYHLEWVARHPARARFLFVAERPPGNSQAARTLSQLNRRFSDRLFQSIEAQMRAEPFDGSRAICSWRWSSDPRRATPAPGLEGRRRSPLAKARRAPRRRRVGSGQKRRRHFRRRSF
jgi:AcrR family transcriptional regulator